MKLWGFAIYISIGALMHLLFVGATFNWSSAWTFIWLFGWPIMLFVMFWLFILLAIIVWFSVWLSLTVAIWTIEKAKGIR